MNPISLVSPQFGQIGLNPCLAHKNGSHQRRTEPILHWALTRVASYNSTSARLLGYHCQDASTTAYKAGECAQGRSLEPLERLEASEVNIEQRAQELIAVDQSPAALTILHEHVTSKRSRNSPITSLEPVMIQFVELCVDLKKGKLAKDGLYQYKNTAQNTNVGTIEVR